MRKLLRSKIGVSLLGAVAILCVAGNFVHLGGRRPLSAGARETASAPGLAGPGSVPVPAPLRIADALSGWRQLFPDRDVARDPFSIAAQKSAAPASTGPGATTLRLQAVSIDGDRALVVVNHRVLAVGESIGEYRLERIQPTQVHFKSRWGTLVVPLERRGTAEKTASGSPISSDLPATRKPASPDPGGR
jgi:hypothetical protein